MRKNGIYIFIIVFIFLWVVPVPFLPAVTKISEVEFKFKGKIGSEDRREELFLDITDVKADSQGNIFILDSRNNCVRKFSNELKFLVETGREGQGPGEMNSPSALALDPDGNVYVADNGNMRINVYDKNLVFLKSIRLKEPMFVRKIFVDRKGSLIILRIPRLKDDSYFNVYSSEGTFLNSFFNEFHPFAPKINSMKELRDNIGFLAYMAAQAALSQDRSIIAFTYEVPENPLVVHLMDIEGNNIRTIKRLLRGYDPIAQRKDIESIALKNKINLQGKHIVSYVRGLHFLEDGSLVLQRYDQIYEDGNPNGSISYLDCFSPDGNLQFSEKILSIDIISIDSNNNVYACSLESPLRSQLVIYSLGINRKAAAITPADD